MARSSNIILLARAVGDWWLSCGMTDTYSSSPRLNERLSIMQTNRRGVFLKVNPQM